MAASVRRSFQLVADRCASYAGRDRVLAAQAPVQLVVQIAAWLAIASSLDSASCFLAVHELGRMAGLQR